VQTTAITPFARLSRLSLARPAANEQGEDSPDKAGTRLMEAVHCPLPLELPYRQAREAFERAYFEQFLARESGSRARVAEKSGLDRTHLYRKLKALGIKVDKIDESA
jgi:DNA-binding NtrC family response regulator